MKQGEKASKYHPLGHQFNTYRLRWDSPAHTVVASSHKSTCLLVHPEVDAGLSIDEVLRLHSYPSEFKTFGCHRTRWRLVGNSIPPLLSFRICSHIRDQIRAAQASRARLGASNETQQFCE
jgi:site-specific DNA-cytosine methylase